MEMENYKMVLVHVNDHKKEDWKIFLKTLIFIIIRFKATPKESLVRVCDIKIIRYGRNRLFLYSCHCGREVGRNVILFENISNVFAGRDHYVRRNYSGRKDYSQSLSGRDSGKRRIIGGIKEKA
ncbi:Uncharacterised protein [Fusobacterium necrophorum subsp. necrophorum]|nr:Uncharacterised protein [Fusobacterium necrophorum subsp. necrophorum]